MNYLAHLYLSGENEKLITGNFIGDYVKGQKYLKFPVAIREGILLHRQIDSFTDSHSCFREVKKLLNPAFGLYSGIVTDMFYDHFLALNWADYADGTLRQFTKKVHAVLLSHFYYLPPRVQFFLPALIQSRRLESYQRQEGIQQSLDIMSRYTSLPDNSAKAMEIMRMNYGFLEENFAEFMKAIIDFVESGFGIVIRKQNVSASAADSAPDPV